MMIGLALMMLAMPQTSGEGVAAVTSGQSKTWTLEYPYVIDPYVGDYYDCLKGGHYVIGDGRNFEEQHRGDIPRCETAATTLAAQAEARLARSRANGYTDNYDVGAIFNTVRQIHIERGRDLDGLAVTRMATNDPNQQAGQAPADGDNAGNTGAISRKSAECIARLKVLRENRRTFSEAEGPKIELVYAKNERSDEEQLALYAYQRKLGQYNSRISFEMRRCPAEARQQRIKIADASDN